MSGDGRTSHYIGLALLAAVAACGAEGPTGPLPDAQGERLVIAPHALLFAGAGEQQQLRAYSIDEEGDSSEVAATFETSDASVVSIAGGIAIGGATLGSAQIVARSGTLVSAPALALRATPASGALLIADSQVVGTIEPLDIAAPYRPGWRYRVRISGTTPAPGQIVLASGGTPIGGRVVSVAPAGGVTDLVLELVRLDEMFAELDISQRLSLEHAALVPAASLRNGFRTTRLDRVGLRIEPSGGRAHFAAGAARPTANAGSIEQEFDLGPFTCKAEVPAPLSFPLTLDVFSFELHPALSLELVIADAALERFVVEGSIAPTISANPLITAALEAKAECKVQLATLILPMGGPLSLIIGGQVPLGVGFEISTKATFGQLGFDAFLDASVDAAFGIDCATGCRIISEVGVQGPSGYFKPKLPSLSGGDLRFELGASAFGWGELTIGNALLEALRFKAVELKAGLEQKMELATRDAQAGDASYGSSFTLKPVLEAKAAANLTPIADLLSVNLATLSFAPELPVLAQSPRGTFTISPASVTPGNGTQLGQLATFTVALTDVNYLGAYAVEGIEIRWRKTDGTTVTLEPGRPGCTDISAAAGQTTFSCQTDFLESHSGPQTFHAFIRTRIFGVPIPVPLEVSSDARAVVQVGAGSALRWTFTTDNDGWDEAVNDGGTVFHLGREGGVLKLHGTGNVGVPNAWIFKQIALPASARTLYLRVSAHDRDGANVAWRVRIVDAAGVSRVIHGWEVISGAEGVHLWLDRSLPIAAFAGTTVTVYVEQDDNGESNHEHFYIDEIEVRN